MVVVVVVVVVIPVGGISGLPRRKAVFFSQSRCSLPHFHVPWPSPLLCSYEKNVTLEQHPPFGNTRQL